MGVFFDIYPKEYQLKVARQTTYLRGSFKQLEDLLTSTPNLNAISLIRKVRNPYSILMDILFSKIE
ncbi:hypothetical protein IO89_19820 [Epilithonimonas lactis]|uniref:Uncharacterized protein n=1 Tax=Epilithonimonas lactis TaxID=421072 RepID=A0A085B5X4_9FLAO|nr:hypothetical protein IO89_19820 [Epilithonimonas lactis]